MSSSFRGRWLEISIATLYMAGEAAAYQMGAWQSGIESFHCMLKIGWLVNALSDRQDEVGGGQEKSRTRRDQRECWIERTHR